MATTTDQSAAYEKAYWSIVSGRYFPGERISLRRFADDLGFGVTATRYAVKRLSAIGALGKGPTGAIALPVLSFDEFSNVIDVLRELEIEVLRRIIEKGGQHDFASLATLRNDYRAAIAQGAIDTARRANVRFWFELYQRAGSPAILAMIEMAWVRVGPAMRLVFKHHETDLMKWFESRLLTLDELIETLLTDDLERGVAAIDAILELHREYYRTFSRKAA